MADGALDRIERAFRAATADGRPVALHVRRGDEVVVDLADGIAPDGQAFTTSRAVLLYSAVKPVVAVTGLLAVADGLLELDAPVARWWPSFATAGKGDVTVAQALGHAAAVPGWSGGLELVELLDWDLACARLAAEPPRWPPGEPGEHVLTYGHLVGELVRRATGDVLADRWRDALEAPRGIAVALRPGTGEAAPAPVDDPGGAFLAAYRDGTGGTAAARLLRQPVEVCDADVVNGPAFRAAQVPAIAGYGSAEGLARLWSWWTGPEAGVRLGEALREASLTAHASGVDHVLERPVAWGLGPQLDPDGTVGMGGIGGCAGWASRRTGVAVGLTTTRLGWSPALEALDEAVLELA